ETDGSNALHHRARAAATGDGWVDVELARSGDEPGSRHANSTSRSVAAAGTPYSAGSDASGDAGSTLAPTPASPPATPNAITVSLSTGQRSFRSFEARPSPPCFALLPAPCTTSDGSNACQTRGVVLLTSLKLPVVGSAAGCQMYALFESDGVAPKRLTCNTV